MPRHYSSTDLAALRSNPGAALPAPKKRSQEESLMQRALMRWWKENCAKFGVHEWCLFSIPNGGGRSGPVTGSILKAEGLRKGAPDLMLSVGRLRNRTVDGVVMPDSYYGLFLELKRPRGIVSPEQQEFHEILTAHGYKVIVCRSLQDAINQITSYLT